MPELLRLLLAAFAVFRIAELIVKDDLPFALMKKLREHILLDMTAKVEGDATWTLQELVRCPYCVGIWISFIVVFALIFPNKISDFLLIWLGLAGMQSFLETVPKERNS